ncbi:threonine--tRNA ligase [Candidatus Parcubacteria bacterium]|nr:MAG: threonine--tRNA ligase [Candidatus Parcubacteria bacterium]
MQQEKDTDAIRHSLAHLLAMAVLEKFPKAQLGIGPVIEHGFYYDFKLPQPLTPEDLPALEARMRELARLPLAMKGRKVAPAVAKKVFKNQPFKLDLIKEFTKEKRPLSIYTLSGPDSKSSFDDLCRGGHVKSTAEIPLEGFKLTHIAGAYWRGNEKNPQLTRIYGLAFGSKAELEDHLRMREEAERRDHKILGKKLGLFAFSPEVGPGLPLYLPAGNAIREAILGYISDLKRERGYSFVWTPHLAKESLYRRSGHLGKYDAMLPSIQAEDERWVVKPMNCPHHFEVYRASTWSYRDLPVRIAENATDYRNEKSGELNGLLRVRSLTQDDTHHIVRYDQIQAEIDMILGIVKHVYDRFGFKKFRARISIRDPKNKKKYFGSDALWEKAEAGLIEAVERWGVPHFIGTGEAAFYGPKIDVLVEDAIGREWQLTTIQLDYVQPENFDLSYTDEQGRKARPAVLHVAVLGSLDRFFAIAIEHFAGAFPFWLAPVQVGVLTVNEAAEPYAREVKNALAKQDIRVWLDERNETIGRKIREAELQKIPYLLVIGKREAEAKTVAVRERGKGDQGAVSLKEFQERIAPELS